MPTQGYVVEVVIPESKCPKTIKNRESLIKDGFATLYLSNNTTSKDADNGITRYGVSSGRNVVIVTDRTFEEQKQEFEDFLNSRFKSDWQMKLTKCYP